MMVVVVPVAVRMGHGLVRVLVTVARRQHEVEPSDDARGCRKLGELDVLTEERPRQNYTQKW